MHVYFFPKMWFNNDLHTFFTMCMDQGDGRWSTMANNLRYEIHKISSYLKQDLWLDPLTLEPIMSDFHEFQLLSSIGLLTFLLICDGGGQLSSRPLNKCFDSSLNGWSINKNLLYSSKKFFFKSLEYLHPCLACIKNMLICPWSTRLQNKKQNWKVFEKHLAFKILRF